MMWGKHIFEKTWGFYWKSSFEQKRIGRLVKTAFHVCGEILYELCVLQTIFPRKFFADLSPNFFVNVLKLPSMCPRKVLEQWIFSGKL